MKNFTYAAPRNVADAVRLAGQPDARFIAGGTDLLNLMKDGAQSHGAIIDINGLALSDIVQRDGVIRIGALARMSDVAAHPAVRRSLPVVSEALLNSAATRSLAAAITASPFTRPTWPWPCWQWTPSC